MKRQAGFTLIEVTIALVIMGVMVVGILDQAQVVLVLSLLDILAGQKQLAEQLLL